MADLTQRINLEIREQPNCEFFYLRWTLNSGGFGNWLFPSPITTRTNHGSELSIEPHFTEVGDTQNIMEEVLKRTGKGVTLFDDNLTLDRVTGLETMLGSAKVEMLLNPTTWETDGELWQVIIVNAGTYERGDTERPRYTFTIEASLQRDINVGQ